MAFEVERPRKTEQSVVMKKGKNPTLMCGDIQELRAAFDSVKSHVAGDTRFITQALMFLAERSVIDAPEREERPLTMSELNEAFQRIRGTSNRAHKRPKTEWQKFFARGMRAHKSPAEIAKEWRARPQLRKVG